MKTPAEPAAGTPRPGGSRFREGETLLLVALAGIGVVFLLLPLIGLLARTPWSDLPRRAASPGALTALRLSLVVSTLAVVVTVVLGFPIAWVLSRVEFRFKGAVRALVMLPMVLPPTVGGVALLSAFGRTGLLGGVLSTLGIQLPYSVAGAVIAAAFVAAPLFVLAVEAGLSSADLRLEDAAATLGASRWRILATVTIPSVMPSISAGLALAWARALGEFGATITFNGNLPGVTQTLPLAVYQVMQTDPDGALVLSMMLLVLSLAVLAALRGRVFRK